MKKITVKLALFFILLICISSILSFFISTFFIDNIENEIKLSQELIASSILELNQKTDLSIEEIINITSTPMYDVNIVENIDLIEITEEEIDRIYNKEIVFLNHSRLYRPTILLIINDSFVQISLHSHNNIFKIVASRVWITLLFYVVIGTLLIVLLAKSVVKPILRLTDATQEVAKGNFDIQVEYKSNDEIGQLTENFNKMTRELKNIEYLRKDFITNVSHEFKTPIASIHGFAKLIQKDNISEEDKKEYANIIVEETTRLSNLSSNMLKLSKLENQEIGNKKYIFYLDEQIRRSILLLEYEWRQKNIEFDIELDKIKYLGDEELLQQVWINLLGNAIKFSNNNSIINVRLETREENVIVKIKDQGIGMNEKTKTRIFEKFYQGDEAHSSEGNGLGLPLVKRIIDLCHGNIQVESTLNKGTTFIIKLPLEYF